jgi:hypothetical protein
MRTVRLGAAGALLAGGLLALLVLVTVSPATAETDAPEPCEAGSYRPPDADDCLPAPPGTYVATTGASSPTPCPAGFYNDQEGQTECSKQAGPGAYVDGTGAKEATLCPPGSYQPDAGAVACLPATRGHFVDTTGARAPTPCPLGTYQPDTGRTSCLAAPPGSFVPTIGSAAAALCPRGTYQPDAGASACRDAAIGFFVPDPGSRTQLACATATRTGLSTCPAATDGIVLPESGDGPLVADGSLCPPGTWSTTGVVPAGGTCIPARPGSFAPGPGATAEQVCAPGSFAADFGSETCVLAPVGTFVAFSGALQAEPCETALEPGATTCDTALAIALPASDSSRGLPGLLLLGIALALAGAIAGLVLLQRKDPARFAGVLGGAFGSARGAPGSDRASAAGRTPSRPAVRTAPADPALDVLAWDEALDGPLETGDPSDAGGPFDARDEDPPVPPTASR